jgi:hypothetical protein
MKRQADLLEVVCALGSGSGLADALDRGQQQTDQQSEDCEHHEQFNQGKPSPHDQILRQTLGG